jgi:hypothetical protein
VRSRAAAALMAACIGPSVASAAPTSHATPAFDALVHRMATVRDYTVTIDAHEVDGSQTDDRVMRFSYRKPDRAKVEIIKGQAAGTRVIWLGGTTAHVRGGLLSLLPVWLDLHDHHITSLRGNTMLRAVLQPTIDCFAAHRDDVSEVDDVKQNGQRVDVVTLSIPGGLRCPADSPKDRDVTRDVLTLVHGSPTLARQERYEGERLVERWIISDVVLDPGLADSDFR